MWRRTCARAAAICRRTDWRPEPQTRRPAAAGKRAAPASALPRLSGPRRSPPAGGLGLHQCPPARQRARAVGLRLAHLDRPGDPQALARRQCARPGAANQSQPPRGPAAHAAVGPALSLAGGLGKNGSRRESRESCCVACRFVKTFGAKTRYPTLLSSPILSRCITSNFRCV